MSDPRHAQLDRWYRRNYTFDGIEVPSVTTLNKNLHSWELENWKIRRAIDLTLRTATRARREVHKEAEPNAKGERHYSGVVGDIIKELAKPSQAATQGISVHEALDSWFSTGRVPPATDAEQPYIEQAIRWAMEWNPRPLYMEPEVYSETGYAGSVDGVFEIGGQTVIVDFKTGGLYESATMQLAAYAHADRLYPRTAAEPCAVLAGGTCECAWVVMPPADRLAVLALRPDAYELQWVTPIAAGLAWKAFLGALHQHQLKKYKALFVTARQPAVEEAA